MDSQIVAAVIGGTSTIAAVVIGWWLHKKNINVKDSNSVKSSEIIAVQPSASIGETNKSGLPKINNQLITDTLTNLSKITVKEIVESINSSPPFQKDKISKQYNGIKVKWIGYLNDASEDFCDKESVRVNLLVEPDRIIGNSFWFTEKTAKFPEIRSLKKGSTVSVIGEIISASGAGLCVDLKPISIEVIEHA